MNAGQSAWLEFLQQIATYQTQLSSYISENFSALSAAHPCAQFQADVTAYNTALNALPIAQLNSDASEVTTVGNIT
jgi:ubiquinone biosynthesis protein UbiJ